jgi:asparagine synthase (glutamine-hydrolysing)
MSAVCGIVSLIREPVSRQDVESMLSALSHHGRDGIGRWVSAGVGFGHQMMHTTPESLLENLPLYIPQSDLAITADIRLVNRDYLFQNLNIPSTEQRTCTDSQLTLRAYEKWGEDCPEHLLGDFAFAIWDGRNRKLFCCRDHMGTRSLMYFFDGKKFIFATEAKGILAVAGVPRRPNNMRLAAVRSRGFALVDNNASFYESLSFLPSAFCLTVQNGSIRKRRYWQPDISAGLPYKKDDEILDAFRELMFQVVGPRVRSPFPVASLLSGGLDSSSIVSVAAKHLEREGKRLTTISSVAAERPGQNIVDEKYYIDQFKTWHNIDMQYITVPDRGPFDNVEKAIWASETPQLTSRHYLYTAFSEAVRDLGGRVLLDGIFGEAGPTFHGNGFYSELFLRLQWIKLYREIKLRKEPDKGRFRSELIRGFVPRHFVDLLRGRLPVEEWLEINPLKPEFVDKHLGKHLHHILAAQTRIDKNYPDMKRNHYKQLVELNAKSRNLTGFPGHHNVEFTYPFADKRMLEFCLAVPNDLKVRDGYKRYLVRAGLDKILPPEIQWRPTKLPFSPDYQPRYNAQRVWAHNFFLEIKQKDPVREVVDVERLHRLSAHDMKNAKVSSPADHAALQTVPLGVYIVVFLRQFSDFKQ